MRVAVCGSDAGAVGEEDVDAGRDESAVGVGRGDVDVMAGASGIGDACGRKVGRRWRGGVRIEEGRRSGVCDGQFDR